MLKRPVLHLLRKLSSSDLPILGTFTRSRHLLVMILEHIGFVSQEVPWLVKIKLEKNYLEKKNYEKHEQVILK